MVIILHYIEIKPCGEAVGESKKSSFTKNASGEEEGRNEGGGRKEGMKGEEGRKGGRRVRMEGIYDRKGCKEGSDMR
jgi:hypothetical protein